MVVAMVLAAQSGPLTIDEAVKIGVENAFAVRSAQADVRRAEAVARQTSGGLFGPKFNALGTYTRFDERASLGAGVEGAIDSKQLQFLLSFPVDITGVRRTNVSGLRLLADASRSDLAAQIEAVKSGIRSAYYGVLRASALVRVADEQLGASRDRLERTKRRFEVGQVARFDVIRLETEVTRAESGVTSSKNDLRLAKNALNNLLARPIDTDFEPVDVLTIPSVADGPDGIVAAAHRVRPEVRAASTRVEALSRLRRAEEGGLLPSLNLNASHTRVIDPGPFERDRRSTAGAEIAWPVWDGGVTRGRVAAAREDERQAQIALEQTKLNVALDVRQAIVRLENASALLATARKQVEQETEALRIANLRFEEGAGILLDVTTAQASLTAAKSDEVTARYEVLSAFAALQRAVGTDDIAAAMKAPEEKK